MGSDAIDLISEHGFPPVVAVPVAWMTNHQKSHGDDWNTCEQWPCLDRRMRLTKRILGAGDAASCGHPNPVWWTDSQLWNEVMNDGDRDEEATGILCPSCFANKADAYFDGSRWRITGWRLVPDWGRP